MTDPQPSADASPDIPAYAPELWTRPVVLPGTQPPSGRSRAEQAAMKIAHAASGLAVGERLGSKDDVRALTGVSVGTVNEAIKLAQERGVITSRPGPGGGLFVADPTPLARMNGWFREAADDTESMAESIRIRDALAPLIIDAVLADMNDGHQVELDRLTERLRGTREAGDVVAFIQSAWDIHEYVAAIGRGRLLDSLYLAIMDVGTSHLRSLLRSADPADPGTTPLYLGNLAQVVEELVDALRVRDAAAAIDALRRTDPTSILRAPGA